MTKDINKIIESRSGLSSRHETANNIMQKEVKRTEAEKALTRTLSLF